MTLPDRVTIQELRAVLGHQIRQDFTLPTGFAIYYIRRNSSGWDIKFFPNSVARAEEAGIYQMWENNFPEELIDFTLDLKAMPERFRTHPQCRGRRIATLNPKGTIFWKENSFPPPDHAEVEKWLAILHQENICVW